MSRIPVPSPPPPDADILAVVGAALDRVEVDEAVLARFRNPAAVAERAASAKQLQDDDWPALSRYREANAATSSPELVMIGDSLTEIWGLARPDLFNAAVANRGIAGQTSGQILLRFMADVVALSPKRVHVLCGTNDIAGNTGPNLPEDYQRNVRAMVALASAYGIAVVLASIPPARTIFWQPEANPTEYIPELNAWLRETAAREGLEFIDYHAALTNDGVGLAECYSADGVHVTRAAYDVMTAMLLEVVNADR